MSAVIVSMAVLIRTFSSGIHTHPVSWNCAYHLRVELSDGDCFPNLVRNCRWTIVPRQSFWITLYITVQYDTKPLSRLSTYSTDNFNKPQRVALWWLHSNWSRNPQYLPLGNEASPEQAPSVCTEKVKDQAHVGGKAVSLMYRPPFSVRKYSWSSFLFEAESTP